MLQVTSNCSFIVLSPILIVIIYFYCPIPTINLVCPNVIVCIAVFFGYLVGIFFCFFLCCPIFLCFWAVTCLDVCFYIHNFCPLGGEGRSPVGLAPYLRRLFYFRYIEKYRVMVVTFLAYKYRFTIF